MKRTAEEWREVRDEVENGGVSLRGAAEKHKICLGTIVYRARVEGWRMSARKGRPREVKEKENGGRREEQVMKVMERAREVGGLVRMEAEAVKEVKVELASYGERMRMVGLRTKRLIAELAERTLKELEEPGVSMRERASALRDLAVVEKVLHRWDRESVEEEVERGRRGAINLALIRTPPELLRGDGPSGRSCGGPPAES